MPLDALNSLPPLPTGASLEDKLARSRVLLDAVIKHLEPARVAVAYTGGKDSGVALALWREALARHGASPLLAISVDTGLKFPEVTALRDQLCADWGVALTIARPEADLKAYPVAQDKISCCRDLKITPLNRAIRETGTLALITGLRRDEHPSRAQRPYAELRPATEACPEHWQVNAVLDWTEMDVWAYITGEALPYCELYHQGYRSLGCMPCTRIAGSGEDERAGRDPDKERQLEILKGLGYF
jgi:phosphoadenosine phosphosulfate reductase